MPCNNKREDNQLVDAKQSRETSQRSNNNYVKRTPWRVKKVFPKNKQSFQTLADSEIRHIFMLVVED